MATSNTANEPRRSDLAWYIAMSASRSTSSALVCSRAAHRDADAGRHRDLVPVELDGRGQARLHPLHDRTDPAGIDVVEQDRELVAAEPRREVGLAQPGAQPLADLRQQPITDVMAERVVDELEAVEVEEHHGVAQRRATGAPERWSGSAVRGTTCGWAGPSPRRRARPAGAAPRAACAARCRGSSRRCAPPVPRAGRRAAPGTRCSGRSPSALRMRCSNATGSTLPTGSDAQHLAHPVEVVGMHRVEPHLLPGGGTAVLVTEHLHASPGVVDGVGREIPIPQAVVRGHRPEAVPLLARAHVLEQGLLFERGGQQHGPLVVRLASVGRQCIDLTGRRRADRSRGRPR